MKCEVCGARSDETMHVCRSPVVEICPVQSSSFRFIRLSASSPAQHLSTGRKKEGRKEEKSGLSPNRLGQLRPPMRMRIESACVLTRYSLSCSLCFSSCVSACMYVCSLSSLYYLGPCSPPSSLYASILHHRLSYLSFSPYFRIAKSGSAVFYRLYYASLMRTHAGRSNRMGLV